MIQKPPHLKGVSKIVKCILHTRIEPVESEKVW